MLSKYVVPGNRLEMQPAERLGYSDEMKKKKVYGSAVYDILSEDRLEIYMPMEKSKLILLPVDAEYDLYFYTSAGLYQCFAKVVDRYKTDHKYLLLLELTTDLRKFQRREFYRLSCALEMDIRPFEKEEVAAFEKNEKLITPDVPTKKGIIVDISGGGIRFVGRYEYEPESLVWSRYRLVQDGKMKNYMLAAQIISSTPIEGKPGVFEHRAKFVHIDTAEREEIIRFIFEEERRKRKREKGTM